MNQHEQLCARSLAVVALAIVLGSCDDGPNAPALVHYMLNLCHDRPTLVAFKNEGADWTAVTLDANNSARIQVSQRFGLAFVYGAPAVERSGSARTFVYFLTPADSLQLYGTDCTTPPTKTVRGRIGTLGSGKAAVVSMGSSMAFVQYYDPTTDFVLARVPSAALDVIAVRFDDHYDTDKVIVRRNQNPADGDTIPLLDFGAVEASPTVNVTVPMSGANPSDVVSLGSEFRTGSGTVVRFSQGSVAEGNSSGSVIGIPASVTTATDLYTITADARSSVLSTDRRVILQRRSLAGTTVVFGPEPATTTVSAILETPRVLRIRVPRQPEYHDLFSAMFTQSVYKGYERIVRIVTTAGYAGSETTWDAQVPDFTGLGIPATAGFSDDSVTWNAGATNSAQDFFARDCFCKARVGEEILRYVYWGAKVALSPAP